MKSRLCIVAIFMTLPTIAPAQQTEPSRAAEPTFKTGKVPDILYAQIPALQRGSGVVVLEAPPKSPARAVGFQRFDIVISCDGALVKDDSQLATLFTTATRREPIPVVVMRQGKLHTFHVSPHKVLRSIDDSAKSVMKPGGPPPLRVTAEPLLNGRFKVNLEYYVGSGKLVRAERIGTLAEIGRQVKSMNADDKMPTHIYDLASAVLEHIRQSTAAKKSPR